ncbi:membrane protein [Caldimonas brevitalea]|uniref:Membrane protein n=1 Tax=Caldimonas brevitalea TaxID=413882 RepID=A0A0G3BHG7_9BURK|nr:membrane protein [Caldimonas brevitalea]
MWAWLRALWPAPLAIDTAERLRVVCGAGLGIAITAWLGLLLQSGATPGPWLVAPLGATAVLVFGVPNSPMAQPWPVVGGTALSALVGVVCARWVAAPLLALSLAVALAIALMLATRSLHPPGGAAALTAVLAGQTDFRFVLFPVLLNALVLALAGVFYNRATGRRYPHPQLVPKAAGGAEKSWVSEGDLNAVLARYNQVLDVSRDDLQALIEQAELHAYRRKLADIRCADIMSRDLVTAEYGTPLQDAWALLRQHRIKALPVVDRAFRVIGIVTLADFMREADLDLHEGFDRKLRALIRWSRTVHSNKPEVVGQIMSRTVRVASAERHIVDLVPLFSDTGHHHIPILGDKEKLVGIITQSDLVRALCRAGDAA